MKILCSYIRQNLWTAGLFLLFGSIFSVMLLLKDLPVADVLYALLLAIPLSGWALNSAAGYPLQWFGLFNLPALVGRDADLRVTVRDLHETLFWALVAVTVLHAAAALYHHAVLRDATLARMLPRGWLRVGARPPAARTED